MTIKKADHAYFGSMSSSNRGSADMMEMIQNSYFGRGICLGAPLSQTGKRILLFKMLCLNVLPILGLWGYTVYRLADSIDYREEYYKRRGALYNSIDLGKLVHRLQVERDVSVLYLSTIGSGTKSFLLAEYAKTDDILERITWPIGLPNQSQEVMFLSKRNFELYLLEHRRLINTNSFSIHDEISFYSGSIETMITWLYNTITESKFSIVWKILVAYQKLASAKENLGVERALGTMFYAKGGFVERSYFENYNKRLHSFRAYMKSVGMYSNIVNEIYNSNRDNFPANFSSIINDFRKEIQSGEQRNIMVDTKKARYFFDNMTIYLDSLFEVQTEMAVYVLSKFNDAIGVLTVEVIVNVVLLILVILICPVVIIGTENLTSSIHMYALTLVSKTKELRNEKMRTDGLLYQMVPKQVAHLLKRNKKVNAEYFKMVTICFSDIYDFDLLTAELTPMEMVELLNILYSTVDEILDEYEVYKVETINDCYMVASGIPDRSKSRHAFEIAEFVIRMVRTVSEMTFFSGGMRIKLRIGINSGPCMAGIVGSLMPRYCLFGDSVNTASRMKAHSSSNQIHISHSTYLLLRKFKVFDMKERGSLFIKGKGQMMTYWLLGKIGEPMMDQTVSDEELQRCARLSEDPGEFNSEKSLPLLSKPTPVTSIDQSDGFHFDHRHANETGLPGEITTIESPTYSASLYYPMPGRPKTIGTHSSDKDVAISPKPGHKLEPTTTCTERSKTSISN